MADLDDLRAVPAARARLDAAELALIDRARRAGATWSDVAEALGLASRQAAEQRRLRLATTVVRATRPDLDEAYGRSIAALRAAAVELHRRIGADRRWDRRFPRAALVRETLAAAPDATAGSLFSLVNKVVGDLNKIVDRPAPPVPEPTSPPFQQPASSSPGCTSPPVQPVSALPGQTAAAVDRLRVAFAAAVPHS